MKKKLTLILACLLTSGCININNSSYEQIIDVTINSDYKIYNTYRKGYKFYLPVGLYIEDSNDYNEVISSEKEKFYLYIDLISYLSKNEVEYEEDEENIYSQYITNDDKTGYVKIKKSKNNSYLVEIAYNYAKIEVIVEKNQIKNCMSDALVILSSIKYNDSFLNNLSEDSLLSYKEETVDIFNKIGGDDASRFLEWVEEYDASDEQDQNIPDLDLIN